MINNTGIRLSTREGITRLDSPIHVYSEPRPHHVGGRSYTASGYGSKIPTTYVTKIDWRKYRIYVMIYSNSGSPYIVYRNKTVFVDYYNVIRHEG